MMTGTVNTRLEAILDVSVEDTAGHLYDTEAAIDTGYSGDLTLPPLVIARLGLRWYSQVLFFLADGSMHWLDRYSAIIMWDYAPRQILVDAVDEMPLIGTRLLQGFELSIKYKVGETVTIDPLP